MKRLWRWWSDPYRGGCACGRSYVTRFRLLADLWWVRHDRRCGLDWPRSAPLLVPEGETTQ